MPPKIRDLKKQLRRAGFTNPSDRGKGSHSLWIDPDNPRNRVNLAGHDGNDAKSYQIKQTEQAILGRKSSSQ